MNKNYQVKSFSDAAAEILSKKSAAVSKQDPIKVLSLLEETQLGLLEAEQLLADIETELFDIELTINEAVASSKDLSNDLKRKAAIAHLKTTNTAWLTAKNNKAEVSLDIKKLNFNMELLRRLFNTLLAFADPHANQVLREVELAAHNADLAF